MSEHRTVEETLVERGAVYGSFGVNAVVMQHLKLVMRNGEKWDQLACDQREALEMIAHKIGRIVNGDPDDADSWHDIAGYARLIEQRIVDPANDAASLETD